MSIDSSNRKFRIDLIFITTVKKAYQTKLKNSNNVTNRAEIITNCDPVNLDPIRKAAIKYPVITVKYIAS